MHAAGNASTFYGTEAGHAVHCGLEGLMRQSTTQTGAKGIVSGQVSNGATWIESFELSQNDLEISGADTSTWKFIQEMRGRHALTLTSGDEITVTQNTTSTIFAINCPQSSLDALCGDYDADFAQQDVSGNITHWLNGVVTFNEEDLGF
jgi:hypothetical protein